MPDSTEKSVQNATTSLSKAAPTRTVSIGILTYKRLDGVRNCVASVRQQLEQPLPEPWRIHEVLVIDNDPDRSARETVAALAEAGPPPIRYVSETSPGIASARRRALSESSSDVLVFIDDDEVAEPGWPHQLLALMAETGAAMVGGPVLSEFTTPPPEWILAGGFFERDDPPHGAEQEWLRSGNLAIDLRQIKSQDLTFDPRYAQGEDSAFTRLARSKGLKLVWSSGGAITEKVGPTRYEVGWRLKREYLSHRSWTRSSLDLSPGLRGRTITRLRVLGAAAVRLGTGAGQLVQAAARRNKADAVKGLVDLVGVGGKLVELVAYRHRQAS